MTMKIGIIVPNVGMSPEALDERRRFLLAGARPGTEIVMVKNDDGPLSIESEFEREEASTHIVAHMLRLSDQGFDAFIPWCAGDPAVMAGRERVSVPVVGPLQSACSFASVLGFRFSVLTPMTNPRLVRHRVQGMGLGASLASVAALGVPVLDLRKDLATTRRLVSEAVTAMAERDGADAVVLACLALFGLSETLKDVPVPVVDPARAAIAMAESLVAMRLSHARTAYPFPKAC
ncbi:aspartate/glutamate racemase family protein [Xanthobacter sp. ZOL 2024]